jgi:hypothetical protein
VTAGQTNDQGLYLRDDALGSRVAPHVGAVRFAKILAELERVAFPVATRFSTADIGRRFAIGSTDGMG